MFPLVRVAMAMVFLHSNGTLTQTASIRKGWGLLSALKCVHCLGPLQPRSLPLCHRITIKVSFMRSVCGRVASFGLAISYRTQHQISIISGMLFQAFGPPKEPA